MPVYDVSAVAQATDFELKQLDNLLSRNALPGVERRRQGIARRLSPDVAVVIRLARELSEGFDIPVGRLLPVAHGIIHGTTDELRIGDFVRLKIDRDALRTSTLEKLDNAVELVGRRARGRPPTGRQRTDDKV